MIRTGSTPTTGWRGCAGPSCAGRGRRRARSRRWSRRIPSRAGLTLYRWRYTQRIRAARRRQGHQKALELAPDDREVLLAAAIASEQKQDMAAMRAYFEKGSRLDPKNLAFALGLARLETREGHLDRAEAVLRRRSGPALGPPGLQPGRDADPPGQDRREGRGGRATSPASAAPGWATPWSGSWKPRSCSSGRSGPRRSREIEMARAVLASDPRAHPAAQPHAGRVPRPTGLRRAAARRPAAGRRGRQGAESARLELVRALARSGKLDQAVIDPLAAGGRRPQARVAARSGAAPAPEGDPPAAGPARTGRSWSATREAEKATPQAVEPLVLLRLDVLAAQGRLDDARALLASALAKDPATCGIGSRWPG